jgi:anti-sigma B factor antagonist
VGVDFSVSATVEETTIVITVAGEVDPYTAPKVRECFLNAIGGTAPHVVFDLSGVSFLDSTGLGVLVACLKRARSMGGEVALRAPQRRAMQVLELTGLHTLFTIHS